MKSRSLHYLFAVRIHVGFSVLQKVTFRPTSSLQKGTYNCFQLQSISLLSPYPVDTQSLQRESLDERGYNFAAFLLVEVDDLLANDGNICGNQKVRGHNNRLVTIRSKRRVKVFNRRACIVIEGMVTSLICCKRTGSSDAEFLVDFLIGSGRAPGRKTILLRKLLEL